MTSTTTSASKHNHPWVHKHSPKNAKEIIGQASVVERLIRHLTTHKPGQKPILLVGKPGVGKTSIVHAIAQELDLELLEVNASDHRNKDAIESIIGGAAKQQSLFFRQKLILVDEVDGVSGMQDRGGIAALIGILPKSQHPIIFTANDKESDKLKPLLKACEVIELMHLDHEQVLARLTHIAKIENVQVANEQLSAIARRSGGDLRAAINDLQSLAGGERITSEDIALLDDREGKEQVKNALLRIFKTTNAQIALPLLDNVDEDVDGLLLWIDENSPREYKLPQDLARAFDALAEADRYFGRIRRWQYYRFYVYIYNLLSAGIAIAKDKKYAGNIEYKPTGRILKMWIYNQKNAKRKKIAQQLAPSLHTSVRAMQQDVLPYLKAACRKNPALRESICAQYDIDDETAEWFDK